ncbi:MAG: hypothetical protein ACTSRP_15105 [Candidatus Helarchaeota archaeon]
MDTLFYDPINFFIYTNPKEDAELPRHGHSKEGLSTLNLIGLNLFCTCDGDIPVFHNVFAGNIQNTKLFKEYIASFFNKLKKLDLNSDEVCLVFDKGNISKKVFKMNIDSGINIVYSIRLSTQKNIHISHLLTFP